ncbi:MAG: outer membrane protein assembly factor BamA, partial [Rhodospirillaceae bacterium]|nr:outer membrane protein assembly factor BamA [Rhodospirillaceae bacterium]
ERINITGNSRTLDEVIRREFRLVEGDAFNTAKLSTTIKRINDLNFFKKVDVTNTPGSAPDKSVINVEVEEKSTGALSLGVGYSSDVGPLVELGIREENLLGKGQSLGLSGSLSGKNSTINLSFTEPYFMDRELAAGFDIFHTTADNQRTSSYSSKQTGLSLRAGYPITEQLRQSWSYTIKSSKVENVKDTASAAIKAQEGSSVHSLVGHVLLYDRRNSSTRPTDGYFLRMNNDLAGLGGDSSYLRNRFTAGHYYTIKKGWLLSTTGSVGFISALGKDLTINDRFFLGGASLRGFQPGGVGPRDKLTGDAVGGELIYNGGADLSFPLGLPPELGVSGKAFTDFGSLTSVNPSSANYQDSGSVRASVGFGVEWVSPMGPLSIEYGIPVMEEVYDRTESFRINFGTRF